MIVNFKIKYYCNRREVKRSEIESSAYFDSHMGLSNNATFLKLLILSIWLMQQKKFLFDHKNDIRDEPALPGRNVL